MLSPSAKPLTDARSEAPRELGEWREIDYAYPGWDLVAGQCAEAGFMQSSAWAAFKRSEGFESKLLGLFVRGELIGGASLLEYPKSGIAICPGGPVLPWHNLEFCRIALRDLATTQRKQGRITLRIEPHLQMPRPGILRNWVRSPIDLAPKDTLFVDLAEDDETRLARMHPKGRYNLRLAWKHDIKVETFDDVASVRTFYALFEESAMRNDFFAEPIGFFLNLASALFPSRMAEVVVASHDGVVLAAMILVYYGRRATYLYGGSASHSRKFMPNFALHWEAMRLARARGCQEYDLYGIDPFGRPNHLYAGISRFKQQWGGEVRQWIGAQDLVFYDQVAERVVERFGMK